jgi:hypothetical protein
MGMFQSFQSSSAVLDPSTNPGLFQSKLVVIIKVHINGRDNVGLLKDLTQDVVDNDAAEIAREYVNDKLTASSLAESCTGFN